VLRHLTGTNQCNREFVAETIALEEERKEPRYHNGRNDRLEIRVTWGAGAVVRPWYLVDVTTGRHAEMRQLAVGRAWESTGLNSILVGFYSQFIDLTVR
jgi:hypothetical protein